MRASRDVTVVTLCAVVCAGAGLGADAPGGGVRGGELGILGPDGLRIGACPLEHTEVDAYVVGFVARVNVRQTFRNPLAEKIEAVYVFPLPEDAAVDGMTMTVGAFRVRAEIRRREEAREVYRAARAAGRVAGLLDQERPNIFTQSVANIAPGARVDIEISYVETLRYEEGDYEFVFPTVVGPRYIPGNPTSSIPRAPAEYRGQAHELDRGRVREGTAEPTGTGWSPDTDQVADASRITPRVVKPGFRAGHDIGLTVRIDAGMELLGVESRLHAVDVVHDGFGRATVRLENRSEIPNRDFVLRYSTSTGEVEDAFLVHRDGRGTFFTLVLQPPARVPPERAVPKEMIFVIDRSGSMSGRPIEKAKETMKLCIEGMNPRDTFDLLSFSGGTGRCFERPVPNTEAKREKALAYLADLRGSGGTEMMPAIHAALGGPPDPERVRIVCFMTDGYIGNDFEIIGAVEENVDTSRVFAFGVGNAVNRFLLGGMAHAGRGEVQYVTLKSDSAWAARRFHERIRSPVLADIEVDWGELPVADVYPRHFPDLFSDKPIMIHGRLTGPPKGTFTLRGRTADGAFARRVGVRDIEGADPHDALASLWARSKVKHLMMQDMKALQTGQFPDDLKDEVTRLGLEHRLMTQFTSFVAVEERIVVEGGEPKTVPVPVEMPDGVSHEGVFGQQDAISSIPLGGTGVVGNIGVGGGAAGAFGFRTGGGRRRAALRGGGSRHSESAVDSTNCWLARNQEADGSWSVAKHGGTFSQEGDDENVTVTGLALLSFLGSGHTEKTGQYKANVQKAVRWLVSRQDATGRIGEGGLGHAVAGLALGEAYGMAGVPRTKAAAQKAVDHSLSLLDADQGGWAHSRGAPPDAVTTAWYVMQLKSAIVAGLSVDPKGFLRAAVFLDKVTVMKGESAGRASLRPGAAPDPTATAACLVARQFMGWKREDPLLLGGANYLAENLPKWEPDGTGVDLRYWYFGQMAVFQMGGDWWKSWNRALRDMLLARRRKAPGDTKLDGSWDPVGPESGPWGRVYSTAVCTLCLEVYYRYLPIYK